MNHSIRASEKMDYYSQATITVVLLLHSTSTGVQLDHITLTLFGTQLTDKRIRSLNLKSDRHAKTT